MRIIGGILSPFVMRAVLAARMKGLDIPVEAIPGGSRSEEHLALNPMGKVPIFVDGDFALPESEVIAEFLEEELDGPSILPGNTEERARARLMARVADVYLSPALTPLFRAHEEPEGVAPALVKLGEALAYMESLLPLQGDWLAGDEHSVADCATMPIFFYLEALEQQFGTATILARYPGLWAWWTHAQENEHGARMMLEMTMALEQWRAAA